MPLRKGKKHFFSRGTDLLLVEAQVCFARDTAVPLGKRKENMFFFFRERHRFASRGGTDLLPREAQLCLSKKEKKHVFFFRERHRFASRGGTGLLAREA